jgi:radical SAM superfamily enzyme YgiQ (UPF0313 family)
MVNSYDIFLTTCPPWEPFNPSPGLGYIAAFLRRHGYKPYVHELNTFLYHNAAEEDKYLWLFEYSHHWNDTHIFPSLIEKFSDLIDQFIEKIVSLDVSVCGLSTAYTKELFTIEFIRRLKTVRPDMKIVLGGPGTTCTGSRKIFEDYISDLIDAFVIGEGEQTLLDYLNALKNNSPVESIPGLLIHKDGRTNDFVHRPPLPDLDKIPFPTYDEFQLEDELQSVIPVFSRSCIGNCIFCNVRALWGRYRRRSPENVFEEIKYLVEEKQITKYQFYDSAINCDLQLLEPTCDLLIKSGYQLDWRALAMPRKNTPSSLFQSMKQAGCRCLEIGVESGSNKVLRIMRKLYNAEDAEEFIRGVHRAGIKVVVFLIVGTPGEDEKEFDETVEFLHRNKDYIDVISSINTFMILEGAPIHSNPEKYGIVFPENRWDLYWHTENGNHYEMRKERVVRLTAVARDLHISMVKDNILE